MIDLSETGPLEMSQIAVLAAAAGAFLWTALRTRLAGAPAFAMFTLVLGAVALREYSPEAADGWQAYLASHAARWHFVVLSAVVVAFVTVRDWKLGVWSHARVAASMAPVLLLGIAVVGIGAAIENWGDTMSEAAPLRVWLLLGEEILELLAYSLVLMTGLWTLGRARRETKVMSGAPIVPDAVRS